MVVVNEKRNGLHKWVSILLAVCMLLGQAPAVAFAQNTPELTLGQITGGGYRAANNDWFVVVQTDPDSFTMPAVSGLQAAVDEDQQAQVWFQSNQAMGLGTGVLSFTVALDQGEHTVVIPAGTELGGYSLKEDFVFYTHADGTMEAAKLVNVTGIRDYNFRGNDWYIIVDTDISDFALTAISGMQMPVDETAVQAWFQINSQLSVPAGSFAFTLATNKAEHTVTIPAGTALGEYTLASDFVFYTHATGAITFDAPEQETTQPETTQPETTEPETTQPETTQPAAKLVNVTGIRAYNFRGNDWYIIVDTDISDFALTAISGMQMPVDETAVQAWFQINSQLSVPAGSFAFTLATNKAEHTVTIPAGTALGEYTLASDFVFYTHATGAITFDAPEQETTEPETTEPETTQPETTQPAAKLVNVTGIRAYNFRGNDWYIIVDTDISDFALTAISGMQMPVDETTVQAWFQINSQLSVPAGSFAFTLATNKAEHTVTIPAGTALGEYTLASDFVFYTHATGAITFDAPEQETTQPETTQPETTQPETTQPAASPVNVTGIATCAYRQANGDWYLVLQLDLPAFRLNGIVGSQLPVDDATAQAWFQINSTVSAADGTLAFTLAADQSAHSVTLPAGLQLGAYTLEQSFVFYLYPDGTGGTEPLPEPVSFQFDRGQWQYVPENGLARYLVWLNAPITDTEIPWVIYDCLTVDGQAAGAYALIDGGQILLVLDQTAGFTNPGNHTLVLKKDSFLGNYQVKEDVVFYTQGLAVTQQPPEQIAQPSETVQVTNDSRNLVGQTPTGLYFGVTPADQLPYDDQKGSIRYSAATGGVYLNDQLTGATVTKWLENLYYIPLAEFGYTPQKGDVVTVDGVFGNGQHAVTFEKQSFVYDGNGTWELGTFLRDLREQPYTVQDISELKLGLSQIPLEPGVQLVGQASQSTNIAIRTIVSTNLDATEFNFGFSKREGMWDKAGWQVWIRPVHNQVYLAHGEIDWQITGHYEFTQEEFVVEFGTVDMHEYVDGVDQGLYCRKIFLKIDGQEVISYKDTDLKRPLGKALYALNSQDCVDGKLISLTSEGVTLRKLSPKIYDYYDLTGVAADTVSGGQTVTLGTTQSASNVAVRMKLNIRGDATELRLALSKQQDVFWDEPATGWQCWLRPRWDTAYLAHGTNDFEVIQPFPYAGDMTVEFGVRDVVIEKNGVQIGRYCRELYLLVNGREVAVWEDTDFSRPIGNYVMLLTSQDTQVTVSTLKKTQTLPVETVVNGLSVENSELVQVNSQVISGKPSGITVLYHSDYNNMTTLNGLYLNDQLLVPVQTENGKAVYLLENPAENDRLRVDLTVKELTVDEPTRIFDLFDTSGKAMVEVPGKTNSLTLGAMVGPEGQAAANSAVRFRLQLPSQFNQVLIGILGDVGTLWSNSGALFQITPNQINFCNPSTVTRLASFYCGLFAPGNSVCVELGVAKCYENGVYRYDRWYVKAGQTQEEMEIVAWYDSVERGRYGGHFCCNGTDLDESYFLYSLKDIYTVTDASAEEDRQLLRTYQQMANTVAELYYPEALEGYAQITAAATPGYIRFFTQPGTKLQAFTVNGVDVLEKVSVGVDGAYCYAIESLTEDITFAYKIGHDQTQYTLTATADPQVQLTLAEAAVIAGGDVTVTLAAQKGFVPQLSVNGEDVTALLTLDAKTGLWHATLRSIRRDTALAATAVARSYTLAVEENENCTLTLGADAANGKLPFGGSLLLTVQPAEGYCVAFVQVGDRKLSVDANGQATLDSIYQNTDTLTVRVELQKVEQSPEMKNDSNPVLWLGIGAAALAAVALGLLASKKSKKKEGDTP